MGTKLTIIAIGLAFIVTVRNYMLSVSGNNVSTSSSLKVVKEACSIINRKLKSSKENKVKKYHPLRPRENSDKI